MLFDTHVLLWWASGDKRLSVRAAREIARSETLYVSPISGWEIATLVRLGRIRLDRDVYRWIADVLEEERVALAQLTAQAAVGAGILPAEGFPGDPADRFLYAQARELAVPFVTKDTRVREYARGTGDVRAVW